MKRQGERKRKIEDRKKKGEDGGRTQNGMSED